MLSVIYSKSADFIIISDPLKLSIYNQYEQSVNQSEKELLLSNTPFQIVNRNELLGDQITEALRGLHSGSVYYIIKDGKGNFKSEQPTQTKIYTKCTVFGDTVTLKKSVTLRTPFSDRSISCKEGMVLVRIFQTGSSFFVLKNDSPKQYGWYDGDPSVFKQRQTTQKTESNELTNIESSIQTRLAHANKIYADYFNYFNSVTQQQKTIPQWNLTRSGQTIKCKLISSNQLTMQMEQSTQYIVQEIEQTLLGKPFTVQYNAGEITIKPR
ncbi:MAG: hypothetical protein GX640_00660 [Fibrobacter sp.]|nr:hypothetical protein [Fibrobacter sp.]